MSLFSKVKLCYILKHYSTLFGIICLGYQLWIWHSDSGVTFHPDIPSLLQTTWQLLSSRAHAVNAWLWSSIAEYNEAASWSEIFNPLKVR